MGFRGTVLLAVDSCAKFNGPPLMAGYRRESEVEHTLMAVSNDEMLKKRKSFQKLSARLRRLTAGRRQTPSEVLLREDRKSGHRDL